MLNKYCISVFVIGCLSFLPGRVFAQQRPNIVFLLTDDQRYDALGAMGNKIIRTPNLDQLAGEGILFQNTYATTAICCVSRASIFTGQYMARHGITDFQKNFTPQALGNTYPALLKKAGYTTAFVGKFGVGNKPPANIFDFWVSTEPEKGGQPPYTIKDERSNDIHDTDTIGNAVQRFLREQGTKGPFCLSVSFKAPHELDGDPPQYIIQDRFKEYYKNDIIPQSAVSGPEYVKLLPPFLQSDSNIARKRWEGLFGTPELYQENVKNYYRLITGVDEVVGNICKKLKELGIDKNTVIVFMGDNGMLLGEHGMEGKWYGYEESIRVPLLIWYPGLPSALKGTKPTDMILNIDVAPTLLSLAGATIPVGMQGADILQILQHKIPGRNEFFYQHHFMGAPKIPKVEGVVTKDLKYMLYPEYGYEELFSIRMDPHETKNIALDKKYSEQLNTMRKKYGMLKASVK